jgi:iron complex transport system ATP-binding protein
VAAGEVVGLVGPNGCGKTTLLKALTRIVPWQQGEVRIDGAAVASMGARELARRVAVVPQSPILPVGFTALEMALMGRTAHLGFFAQEGAADERIALDALTQVDAYDLRDRRVDELSGGERQKVVIARALAQQAPLLLLDEPTSNLDLGHQIGVMQLARRLAAEQRTGVLAALHELTLAALYCDRIVLMSEGRVLADGSPGEVLTVANLQTAYGVAPVILDLDGVAGPVVLPLPRD